MWMPKLELIAALRLSMEVARREGFNQKAMELEGYLAELDEMLAPRGVYLGPTELHEVGTIPSWFTRTTMMEMEKEDGCDWEEPIFRLRKLREE